MIERLNSFLRKLIFLAVGLTVLFKLTESNEDIKEPDNEGFQSKEFDDIW